jgi:hypothetical protein
MRIVRNIAAGLFLLALGVFVWQNQSVIFSLPVDAEGVPQTTRFLLSRLQVSAGTVLLGFIVAMLLLSMLELLGLRTSSMMEGRRHAKEMEAARKLADEAEASRFSALQDYVATELGQLRMELEERHNIVLATYGELDDRISRSALPKPEGSGAEGVDEG